MTELLFPFEIIDPKDLIGQRSSAPRKIYFQGTPSDIGLFTTHPVSNFDQLLAWKQNEIHSPTQTPKT